MLSIFNSEIKFNIEVDFNGVEIFCEHTKHCIRYYIIHDVYKCMNMCENGFIHYVDILLECRIDVNSICNILVVVHTRTIETHC